MQLSLNTSVPTIVMGRGNDSVERCKRDTDTNDIASTKRSMILGLNPVLSIDKPACNRYN